MYSIPVWRGPAGGLEPEDRVRVDAAIETAETINARIGEATEAAEIATEAAAATDADAQATEAGRQQAVQAAGDAAAARAAAEQARILAEQQRQAAEAAAVAAAQSARFYDTIAAGRAAVADGEQFGVRAGGPDGLTRPTIYRRDSASTQTEMVTIVNPSEVDAEVSAREALGRRVVSVSEASAASLEGAPGEWGIVVANADGFVLGGFRDGKWVPEPEVEIPQTLIDDVAAAQEMASGVDARTQGVEQVVDLPGFEDWSFVVANDDGYVLGGLRNGVWLPSSGGGGPSSDLIAQLDARNMARSRAIQETPIWGVQLPIVGWNIAISYGQSLAEGETTAPALSRSPVPGTYMMGDNVDNITPPSTSAIPYNVIGTLALNPLIARTHSQTGLDSYNLSDAEEAALAFGAINRGEVPIIALANGVRRALDRLAMDDSGRNIVAISPAFAARNVSALSKGTPLYGVLIDGLTKARDLALAEGGAVVVPIIHYLQGEQDYSLSSTPDNTRALYFQRVNQLFDDLASDVMTATGQAQPPLILFGQTTKTWTNEVDASGTYGLSVGMAQMETALTRRDAVMVGPTYPYTNTGGHLDSNGSRWYGCHAAKVARRIMQGKGHQPTRIIEVRREDARNILVSFHVPVPPLQFRAPYNLNGVPQIRADRGFRVTSPDTATNYPVTEVQIVGQTMIRVTTSADIPNDAIFWLAGRSGGVVGLTNICDSDPEVAFDRYEYLPERGMIASQSHDELNGEPYPLENWACAFSGPIGYTEFA
ncbi:hypothetical protein [Paracoccus yeei]|uniref:hypothetical protein n=1 Tax=Paracoccus yeei TaxID=147645 RepID=UPI001748B773|nr:hypothetical protein [Paracoccus yeei]